MRFYAIGYDGLLNLPIYTFWELSRNVDRLAAEEDARLLVLLSNAFSDRIEKFHQDLERRRGDVVMESNEVFDAEGLNNLRRLLGG